jgi:hypothetical protein
MTNFKQETMELIGNHEIDEYMLKFSRDWYLSTITSYKGKGKITWDGIQASMLNYDKSYGTQNWRGFITFKDTPDWLEREEYDGMEWWAWRSKPSLEKEERIAK